MHNFEGLSRDDKDRIKIYSDSGKLNNQNEWTDFSLVFSDKRIKFLYFGI